MPDSPLRKAVRSLNLHQDYRDALRGITSAEWPNLLPLTDRSQITLPLGIRCRDYLPADIRDRIDRNLANNVLRQNRLFEEYRLVAGLLEEYHVDFVVLKGLAHIAPYYSESLSHRPQYDIDLYCPPSCLDAARQAMTDGGFAPIRPQRGRTDHLPPMIRDTNWKWRGDYYAPDLPLTVELHFRFWDQQTERLPAWCVDNFWRRRTRVLIRGVEVPVLRLADSVSYASLHLVRHLFRGDLRIFHVYELAYFLDHTANDDELWRQWQDGRPADACRIEAVAFRLASEWFGCRVHPTVTEVIAGLPPNVAQWFEVFADSPLSLEKPNKDELFLHLGLLTRTTDRLAILTRRLLPVRAGKLIDPSPRDGTRVKGDGLRATMRKLLFIARRALYHMRTTVPLLRSLLRWRAASRKYAV